MKRGMGMRLPKISHLMDAESWFNAKKAVELGFADKVLFGEEDNRNDAGDGEVDEKKLDAVLFSRQTITNSFLSKLIRKPEEKKTPVDQLEKRLNLLSH